MSLLNKTPLHPNIAQLVRMALQAAGKDEAKALDFYWGLEFRFLPETLDWLESDLAKVAQADTGALLRGELTVRASVQDIVVYILEEASEA